MTLIPPNVGTPTPPPNVEENELAAQYRKTIIEIQSQLFDKSSTYSNLILVAGYAGAFTIWGNTRNILTHNANILIAMLLGLSLCIFIAHQVFKLAGHVAHFRRVRALLAEQLPLPEFFSRYNELESKSRSLTLQSGVRVSMTCFWAIVIPAILAIGLLFFNFAAQLVGFPMWPK